MGSHSDMDREVPIIAPSLNFSVLKRIGAAVQTGGKEGSQRDSITQLPNLFHIGAHQKNNIICTAHRKNGRTDPSQRWPIRDLSCPQGWADQYPSRAVGGSLGLGHWARLGLLGSMSWTNHLMASDLELSNLGCQAVCQIMCLHQKAGSLWSWLTMIQLSQPVWFSGLGAGIPQIHWN